MQHMHSHGSANRLVTLLQPYRSDWRYHNVIRHKVVNEEVQVTFKPHGCSHTQSSHLMVMSQRLYGIFLMKISTKWWITKVTPTSWGPMRSSRHHYWWRQHMSWTKPIPRMWCDWHAYSIAPDAQLIVNGNGHQLTRRAYNSRSWIGKSHKLPI